MSVPTAPRLTKLPHGPPPTQTTNPQPETMGEKPIQLGPQHRTPGQRNLNGTDRRLAPSCRLEALTTLPGGCYSPDYLRSSWDEDVAVMRRGVNIRALYQADAARTPEVLRYLVEFADLAADCHLGVSVRDRHFGVFVRTVRRRVATVMDLLGCGLPVRSRGEGSPGRLALRGSSLPRKAAVADGRNRPSRGSVHVREVGSNQPSIPRQ